MTDQASPSFEDLEPEGQPFEDDGRWGGAEDPGAEGFDGYMAGPGSMYEFDPFHGLDDLETFDSGEPQAKTDRGELFLEGPGTRSRTSLPNAAARIAFRWASQAQSGKVRGGNSRKPRQLDLRGRTSPISSAALSEANELVVRLASVAANTEDETEAVGLAAALVPVAISMEPQVYRAMWAAIPALVRGTMGVALLLHRRPSMRSLIRFIPEIILRTTEELGGHVLDKHAPSRRLTARILARSTGETFASLTQPKRNRRSPRRSGQDYDDRL